MAEANADPFRQAWLSSVVEPVIDPGRPIVDPHHHLWRRGAMGTYLLPEWRADMESGHRIEKTVFVECTAFYRESGPEIFKPVGETEGVAAIAADAKRAGAATKISAIVGYADLTLGEDVARVLAAHIEAGRGLFRGIRHRGAWDPAPEVDRYSGVPHLFADARFRAGFAVLDRLGLTFEAWCYHPQISEVTDLARAFPNAAIVLDHYGGPLGIGPYKDREEVFARWSKDMSALARCPNVHVKCGGAAMPLNGFGWHKRPKPATSDELAESQRRYFMHTVEAFGPERCMFESNFPVDKLSVSYSVLWNALKKLAAGFSEAEKDALFRGTASRFYTL